jgi:hypothetical protein
MMRTVLSVLLRIAVLSRCWQSALAAPGLHFANILDRAEQVRDEYDYIIIGAGTAGLTVADRLTEDGKCLAPGRSIARHLC